MLSPIKRLNHNQMPDYHKSDIFKDSQKDYDDITDFLLGENTQKMKLDEVEDQVKTKGRKL